MFDPIVFFTSKAVAAVLDAEDYAKRADAVAKLQADIESLTRELDQKTGARDQELGIADGQNSQTAGTLLFETLKPRNALLAENRGNEDALEPWGFDVAVGSARSPVPPKKPAA